MTLTQKNVLDDGFFNKEVREQQQKVCVKQQEVWGKEEVRWQQQYLPKTTTGGLGATRGGLGATRGGLGATRGGMGVTRGPGACCWVATWCIQGFFLGQFESCQGFCLYIKTFLNKRYRLFHLSSSFQFLSRQVCHAPSFCECEHFHSVWSIHVVDGRVFEIIVLNICRHQSWRCLGVTAFQEFYSIIWLYVFTYWTFDRSDFQKKRMEKRKKKEWKRETRKQKCKRRRSLSICNLHEPAQVERRKKHE